MQGKWIDGWSGKDHSGTFLIPSRYPRGKFKEDRVTIGVGILTSDSVVLAADTQMSWTDFFLKTGEGKVSWAAKTEPHDTIPQLSAGIGITGAGHAKYVKHIQRHFSTLISRDKHPSKAEFVQHAEAYVEEFYKKHILPIASVENNRPNVWLLFAYQNASNEVAMFSTSNDVVTPEYNYAAVGVGQAYAEMLLAELFKALWPLTTETAILIATYVVKHVKDHVQDCGKETDLVFLTRTGVFLLQDRTLKELDALIEETMVLKANVAASLLSDRHGTDSLSEDVVGLRKRLLECLHADLGYRLWQGTQPC